MKRLLAILLGLILVMSMTGCGGSESSTAEEDAPAAEETVEEKSEDLASLVDPDFKAAMDNYEEFIDEYIAFMEKYSESDNAMEMMGDYMEYMQKYQEVMASIDEINEDDLNDAELAYYTEVNLRVSQKLLEVSESM